MWSCRRYCLCACGCAVSVLRSPPCQPQPMEEKQVPQQKSKEQTEEEEEQMVEEEEEEEGEEQKQKQEAGLQEDEPSEDDSEVRSLSLSLSASAWISPISNSNIMFLDIFACTLSYSLCCRKTNHHQRLHRRERCMDAPCRYISPISCALYRISYTCFSISTRCAYDCSHTRPACLPPHIRHTYPATHTTATLTPTNTTRLPSAPPGPEDRPGCQRWVTYLILPSDDCNNCSGTCLFESIILSAVLCARVNIWSCV